MKKLYSNFEVPNDHIECLNGCLGERENDSKNI